MTDEIISDEKLELLKQIMGLPIEEAEKLVESEVEEDMSLNV